MAFARDDLAGREHPTDEEAPSVPPRIEELEEEDDRPQGTRTEPLGRLFHTRQTLQIRMARIPSEVHRRHRTHHHHHEKNIRARQVAEEAPSVVNDAAVPTGTGVFPGVLNPLVTITGGSLGDPVRTVIEDPSTTTPSTSSTTSDTGTESLATSTPLSDDGLDSRSTVLSDTSSPTSSLTPPVSTGGSSQSGPGGSSGVTTIDPAASSTINEVPPSSISTETPFKTVTTYISVPLNGTQTTIPAARTATTSGTITLTSFRSALSSTKSGTQSSSKASSSKSSSKTPSTKSASTRTFTTTTGTIITTITVSSTGVPGFGGGGGVGGGPEPTLEPSEPGSGGSSTGLGPTQTKLLGGILGGVAGLALLLIAFLFLIKKYKRQSMLQRVDDAGYGGPLEAAPDTSHGSEMAERSSFAPLAMAGSFLARQRHAHGAAPASPEAAGGEKGFYKVSGRKLPPAIGGVRPDFSPHLSNAGSASGGSPQPGRSFSAGPLAPMTTSTAPSTPPPFGITVKSATPTSEKDYESAYSSRRPPPPPPPPPMVRRQTDTPSGSPTLSRPAFPRLGNSADGLGRSLVGQDGSRGSRFTEDVT